MIAVHPWMQQHDPQISCHNKEITKWSESCIHHYLLLPCTLAVSSTFDSPETQSVITFLENYHELVEVFSKDKVSRLQTHRMRGISPPLNCIYPLSLIEQYAMEEYVQEALQK